MPRSQRFILENKSGVLVEVSGTKVWEPKPGRTGNENREPDRARETGVRGVSRSAPQSRSVIRYSHHGHGESNYLPVKLSPTARPAISPSRLGLEACGYGLAMGLSLVPLLSLRNE